MKNLILDHQNKLQKRRNTYFNNLPADKKRVKIAKDVLVQIDLGVIVPTAGIYFDSWDLRRLGENGDIEENTELQNLLREEIIECRVCGIGSLFVCDILNRNNLKLNKQNSYFNILIGSSHIHKRLKGIFTSKQLDLIEKYFENWVGCRDFFRRSNIKDITSSEERMIIIMKNIIKNKGTFNPKN